MVELYVLFTADLNKTYFDTYFPLANQSLFSLDIQVAGIKLDSLNCLK